MSPFPEGEEGVQHYHVRGRNPINLYSPRALVRVFLLYPKQMGTDLNPTENAFGGDPEKMSNEGRVLSIIVHLRPQAPPQAGIPDAAPA